MFIEHNKEDYDDIRKQHNIMVLVGNGFDIAALSKYGQGSMKGKNTSYTEFYNFMSYYDNLYSKENLIYKKMKCDNEKQKKNWNDFEMSIDELIMERSININKLEENLKEIQNGFSRFLYDIVTTDVLLEINQESQKNELAITSLSKFLGDLGKEHTKLKFEQNIYHFDLFNFLFVNFNYTMILDNYIYLDKTCFDPHKHKTVDRNFEFFTNFRRINPNERWSSYVLTNIIHPHGNQYTPRSILFGTDLSEYDKTAPLKKMIKPFWAQDDVKYRRYFDDTELFIIYGMSLSITDGWWMKKIYDQLIKDKAELIIYYYGADENPDKVKQQFLYSCSRYNHSILPNETEYAIKNIRVILLTDNNNYFLGFARK